MKKILWSFIIGLFIVVPGMAIAVEEKAEAKIVKETKTTTLCGKCGQIKGTDACCKVDAQKCTKCGLTKGSPGCCKLSRTK
jgi:hypothetical protein